MHQPLQQTPNIRLKIIETLELHRGLLQTDTSDELEATIALTLLIESNSQQLMADLGMEAILSLAVF